MSTDCVLPKIRLNWQTGLAGALSVSGAFITVLKAEPSYLANPPVQVIPPEHGACKDFQLATGLTAASSVNQKGQKTYTITVPDGCSIQLAPRK